MGGSVNRCWKLMDKVIWEVIGGTEDCFYFVVFRWWECGSLMNCNIIMLILRILYECSSCIILSVIGAALMSISFSVAVLVYLDINCI